ncbi:hypothetical protein H5410_028876 [Solanum commersonii]|uniref:Major facilitator superfamily (MFS) profile domain-containing protein n=1 Tax=Solanum commersonii TaxID=4109 RepID=A0A9J5Z628_SOLCO|nr:hypothetical protein H5410_028876 [Solanum commersonii]
MMKLKNYLRSDTLTLVLISVAAIMEMADETMLIFTNLSGTDSLPLRALNGIGLAIVTPAILSLVADSTDDTNRGTAFGWLSLTGGLGSIIGALMSVLIAETSFMGIPGWRISFHLVGIISVLVDLLVSLPKIPAFLTEMSMQKIYLHRNHFKNK